MTTARKAETGGVEPLTADELATRYYDAFNDRDWDAFERVLAEEVDVSVDAEHLLGIDAAEQRARGIVAAYPGVAVTSRIVTVGSHDTVVSEFFLRPFPEHVAEHGEPGWRVDGLVCEVLWVRDGKIASIRSFYVPAPTDFFGSAPVPSRFEAAKIAHEQTALRRVATRIAHARPLPEILGTVVDELGPLVAAHAVVVVRFDGDRVVTEAMSAERAERDPEAHDLAAEPILDALRTTRTAVRSDDHDAAPGALLSDMLGRGPHVVAAPILVDSEAWGAIAALRSGADDGFAADVAERLEGFADLVTAAITSAHAKALLRESRARVVATADETRRRLQRDVHDAAQQRLAHTIITLKMARDAVAADPARVPALVDDALRLAERANVDLRDVVHGILPAALAAGGLRAGVESLVDTLGIPVRLAATDRRLSRPLETTAYFIVAEALTNVVKHADASAVDVVVEVDGDRLDLVVRDDGRGGADAAGGTGITGLFDRVAAAEGVLEIDSPRGVGTTVHAVLPLTP